MAIPKYERHPLSAKYPDIKGQAWLDFLENVKTFGHKRRKIMLYEDKVLDGWQFYRACKELNLEPDFVTLPKGLDPEAYVETTNEHRRHEDPETLQRRACDRRDRVARQHAAGKPIRTIAEEEDVSEITIRRDLDKANTTDVESDPPDGTITTKSGKKRKARNKNRKNTKKTVKPPKEPKYCQDCTRKGKPCCKKCEAKFHAYREKMEKFEPPEKEADRLDFLGVPFDEMRQSLRDLRVGADSALKLMEESKATEFNKVVVAILDTEVVINEWHKRAIRQEEKKAYIGGRRRPGEE